MRIRDVYPGSGMFIPDPGSQNSNIREGGFCPTFFRSHKYHKIETYFIFELVKKKIWDNLQRIIELLPQKLSISSKKIGKGLGSEIRDPEKTYPDPGSGGQKGPDPDPQHCAKP